MFLLGFLQKRFDPERLISRRSWISIVVLATCSGLLFGASLILLGWGERAARRTIATYERYMGTHGLASEVDALQVNTHRYERNLRAVVDQGDTVKRQDIQKNKDHILSSRSKISTLILQLNRPLLARVNALTDSAFVIGDRSLELLSQGNKPAAQKQLALLESIDLQNQVSLLSVRMVSNRSKSLVDQMQKTADATKSSLRTTLVILSALSGIMFVLLLFGIIRTVRQVLEDRRNSLVLNEERDKAATFSRNLVNLFPVGYHSIDAQGILVDINQAELDMLGYTREELVGRPYLELLDEPTRARVSEYAQIMRQRGFLYNVEGGLLHKTGHSVPVLFNTKAIYDAEGRFAQTITATYDFAERKRLEEALVSARQEAEKTNHLKQLFMANMSHEIRTPLNAIIGFANMLGRADLNSELREFVRSIQISGANLLTIVNDILDFEKIQSGMLRVEQIEFDLPGLVHSVTNMVRPSAEEKRLSVQLSVDPDLPALLIGDPLRLTQILVNLLYNAIKFTDTGSITLRLWMVGSDQPDNSIRVRFEVEDTGIGIAASEHERIFERFMQAGNDMTRKYGGTGLGLALVKMLVELQNGSIRLDSEVGKGSVFTVELPFQLISAELPQPAVSLQPDQSSFPNLSGFNILVVEDNPMNRRIAELHLLEFGLSIIQAEDGLEAIELLRDNPSACDLVLMDIQMPGLDGHSTTQIIRYDLKLNELPIIAMTAHVLSGERAKVLASGMNDYLTKPVRLDELTLVLLRHLPGFWDDRALREHALGNAKVRDEIVSLFIEQFPREMAGMRKALDQKDCPALAAQAHSLRSTVSYAGFQASLGKTLHQIEQEARNENPDPDRISAWYTELTNNGRHAVALLQREFGKKR